MLETFRCDRCGRILMETNQAPGQHVRIKCPSCGTFNTLRVATPRGQQPGMPGYEKRGVA